MSDNKGLYWQQQSGVYTQPQVINPPMGQNANNARHAVWHLGNELEVELYPASAWRAGDGDEVDDLRHTKGPATVLTIWGTAQPYHGDGGSSDREGDAGGESVEGMIVVHIDSHQPENIAVAADNEELFPSGGIRLTDDEDKTAGKGYAHAALIRWQGRRWKVMQVIELFEAGDEENGNGAVYRCLCARFTDKSQELTATPAVAESVGESNFWGPS